MYVSKKCCEDEHVDLLLIGEGGKKHYVLIKDFNIFMYDHIFIMEGKQTIKMTKKGKYIKFKHFGKKIKPPFMIYEDFENIAVPKDDGKQNLNEFYSNKYEIHVVSNYGYN